MPSAMGDSRLIVPRLPPRHISRPRLLAALDRGADMPLTLLAGIGHWLMGSTNWLLLAWLLAGSIPGIIIGSYLAVRIPDAVLRPILAATLAVVAAKLLF